MFLLIALLIGLLGSGIVLFVKDVKKNDKLLTFGILFVIYAVIDLIIIYLALPSTAWPLYGGYGAILIVQWIISAIVATIVGGTYNSGWHWGWLFPIISVVLLLGVLISNSKMLNSGEYASLIGKIKDKNEKHWSQDIQPLDPTHIRLVPPALAIALAKTALSQGGTAVGSQFPLLDSSYTLQKIVNDYWYLIPLDFRNFRVWTNTKNSGVPGYVKVSATDPYFTPELILGKRMIYTPNAYFSKNLQRILYKEYKNKVLKDYSFEEDDNGNIYWVITVCHPSIGYNGLIVEGVILFDPETGEHRFITKEEVNKNPDYAWIDRVLPSELAKSYIDYWGSLKDGWWNYAWDHVNLLIAETPTMNYSSENRCIHVTPITSDTEKDQTMTGLMYADARTGEFTYYTVSGGATEQAIIETVNNATGYKNWHGSEQIVYENVYGKLSALVPILGANGNYQGLAIVENENKRCAIGLSPQEALVEFQKLIMNAGGQITTENSKNILEYRGKITRLGWDISGTGKQYYLLFEDFNHSFIISSSLQSELSLTKEGDLVYIKYFNSEQAAVPTIFFENITLNLKGSENEQKIREKTIESQGALRDKAGVKDFKEEIKQMSDEEIRKLMDAKK